MAYGISNTAIGNMTTGVTDITVSAINTDGGSGQGEYSWQNTEWSKYWGYFNSIPELKSALLMKATWVTGKGFTADAETTVICDHMTGWGKDTFKDILFNQYLIARLAGDSFAEIIKDKKTGLILNLKPLDPGSIKIVVDEKGILKRYEQVNKISNKTISFEPGDIFHLSHNRLADQIHGVSDLVAMEQTILAELENFTDLKKIMHRQARPMLMFKLGTDDPTKISAFVTKMDMAVNKGENIYIPNDTNTVEVVDVKAQIGGDIFAWREDIRNKFYRTLGLPLIVFGNGGTTESGGKIEYLAHEQIWSHDQLFIEQQVWNQLFLKIKLNSPVTLLDNLQTDQAKDANQGMEIQPSDFTAGGGA